MTGLLGYGAVCLLSAVFTISLIGIPLALIVFLLCCAFTLVGSAAVACLLGQKVAAAMEKPDYSELICVLIGGILLGILAIIPVLGWISWTLISLFGFGAVLQMQWEKIRQKHA